MTTSGQCAPGRDQAEPHPGQHSQGEVHHLRPGPLRRGGQLPVRRGHHREVQRTQ